MPRLVRAGCVFASCIAPTFGQAVAGDEHHTAIAQALSTAGGAATVGGMTLESTVGQGATGDEATLGGLTLQSSVSWASPVLGTDRPIVHGVAGGTGSAEGGESVTVLGLNFDAPGAGAADVRFDGALGSSTSVVGNTTITTTTPFGRDGSNNPFGAVAVEVSNNIGSADADQDFLFLPAVEAFGHAQVGASYTITLLGEPGTTFVLAYGGHLPAAPYTLPGVAGTSALSTNAVLHGDPVFAPSGTVQVGFDVPNLPVLANQIVEFQALAIEHLVSFSGSFTNVLHTTIHP